MLARYSMVPSVHAQSINACRPTTRDFGALPVLVTLLTRRVPSTYLRFTLGCGGDMRGLWGTPDVPFCIFHLDSYDPICCVKCVVCACVAVLTETCRFDGSRDDRCPPQRERPRPCRERDCRAPPANRTQSPCALVGRYCGTCTCTRTGTGYGTVLPASGGCIEHFPTQSPRA